MDYGIRTGYFRFVLLLAALVAAVLLVGETRSFAQDWYLLAFDDRYQAYDTTLDTCQLCHPGHPMSYARNGFGSDFADPSIGNHTFNGDLENADSDGDGFTNIQEILELTFPGDPASRPASAVVSSLAIYGPASLNEGQTASYSASASWSDGTESTVEASWTVSPETIAAISAAGELTASLVDGDRTVTVSATFEGVVATCTVTITDLPPPSSVGISLVPTDGTTDVPVTAVVTATGSGSTDISLLVNEETFSLTIVVAASSPSMEGAEDPACVSGGIVIGSIDYNDARTEATFTPLCRLAHSTTYKATVIPPASPSLSVPAEPVTTTFQTVAWTPDSDGDGVGDGEDDIPHDNGKATPPSTRMTGKFLVEAYGNAGYALRNAEGISDMYPQLNRRGRPFGFHFPDGLVRYALAGVPLGGSVTVAVTFPSGCPAGSKVFKIDSGGFREAVDAVVDGNRVVVTLTDGGIGDADGVVNGEIVDPIGLAVPEASGDGSIDSSSPGTGGGGCAMMGNGRGGEESAGSIGLVLIAFLGFALLGRKSGRGW